MILREPAIASQVRRALLLASAGGLLVGSAPPAGAQAAGTAVVKVDAAAEITAALVAAAFTVAATERSADREIQSLRQRLLAVLDEVRAGSAEASALQAARQTLLDRLATKDREFAIDMMLFRQSLERIVATPDGAQALRRFNGGEQREALEALDKLAASRRAARQSAREQEDTADAQTDPQLAPELKAQRQKKRNTEDALDLRDNARLALEALGRQRGSLADVIERFVQVTRLDPTVSLDSVTLSRLYRQAGRLDSMTRAAQDALRNALKSQEQALALSEAGSADRLSGRLDAAQQHFEDALKLRLRAASDDPRAQDLKRYLSVAYERLGELALDRGRFASAIDRFTRNVELRRDLLAGNAPSLAAPRDLAVALSQLTRACLERGDVKPARESLGEALTLNKRALDADSASLELQRDQAILLARAGDLESVRGEPAEAQRHYAESLQIRRRLASRDLSSVRLVRDVVAVQVKLADLELQRTSNVAAARSSFADAYSQLAAMRDDAGEQASELQRDLIVVTAKQGLAKALVGDHDAAISEYTRALESLRKSDKQAPGQYLVQRDMAQILTRMGDSLLARGDAKTARDRLEQGLKLREEYLERDPGARTTRALIVQSLSKLGLTYKRLNDNNSAKRAQERVNDELTRLTREGSGTLEGVPDSPSLMMSVALLAEAMNDMSYAERVGRVVDDMRSKKLFSPLESAALDDIKKRRGKL